MHELTITENILKVVVPAAEKAGAKRILKIRMKAGELSGIIPIYLEKCFEQVSEGTIAEGAQLILETVPASIRCLDCGYEGAVDKKTFGCAECGSLKVKVVSGRDYFIDDLEVE